MDSELQEELILDAFEEILAEGEEAEGRKTRWLLAALAHRGERYSPYRLATNPGVMNVDPAATGKFFKKFFRREDFTDHRIVPALCEVLIHGRDRAHARPPPPPHEGADHRTVSRNCRRRRVRTPRFRCWTPDARSVLGTSRVRDYAEVVGQAHHGLRRGGGGFAGAPRGGADLEEPGFDKTSPPVPRSRRSRVPRHPHHDSVRAAGGVIGAGLRSN